MLQNVKNLSITAWVIVVCRHATVPKIWPRDVIQQPPFLWKEEKIRLPTVQHSILCVWSPLHSYFFPYWYQIGSRFHCNKSNINLSCEFLNVLSQKHILFNINSAFGRSRYWYQKRNCFHFDQSDIFLSFSVSFHSHIILFLFIFKAFVVLVPEWESIPLW